MDKGNTPTDLMRYDLRIQDALRGAVRTLLSDVARIGFPGDHHFYISFRTRARGVQMSERLLKQYPDEMTIVLQHQFWDLTVGEKEFSVGLSFKQIPEKLVIPFEAITGIADPTVNFVLRFEVAADMIEPAGPAPSARPPAPSPAIAVDKGEPLQQMTTEPRRTTPKAGQATEPAPAAVKAPDQRVAERPPVKEGEAGKIVSIDAFRKKP